MAQVYLSPSSSPRLNTDQGVDTEPYPLEYALTSGRDDPRAVSFVCNSVLRLNLTKLTSNSPIGHDLPNWSTCDERSGMRMQRVPVGDISSDTASVQWRAGSRVLGVAAPNSRAPVSSNTTVKGTRVITLRHSSTSNTRILLTENYWHRHGRA